MSRSFGNYICERRLSKGLSLREFSKLIGISPEYLSKIEHGQRAAPKDSVVERIADSLSLNQIERESLLDLAAQSQTRKTLAKDLVDYIYNHKYILIVLRTAKRRGVGDKEWKKILDNIL